MSKLFEDYLSWSLQLKRALKSEVLDAKFIDVRALRGISFLGMGGSGIIGDVLTKLLSKTLDIPVVTIKDYTLPKFIGKDWLVVALSYSGETLETIMSFSEAVKRGAITCVVASGGRLMAMAEKVKSPRIVVEGGHTPRSAFPALLAGTINLINSLLNLDLRIESGVEVLEDQVAIEIAEDLAKFLFTGVPVFVVTDDLYPLGLRAKNEFNENSKIVGKVEVLPEWGHNDIVGWEGGNREWFKFVLFKEGPGLIDFASDYLRELGYNLKVLNVSKPSYLETMLYGSWIVGLSSVILAKLRGLDPEETKSIKRYKDFLKSYFK
ncbi:MAG: SIS domain-containing protein [Candidatus Nezhaarchaeales archaeon]